MKTAGALCVLALAIPAVAWAGSSGTNRMNVKCDFTLVGVDADTNHGAMGRFTFQHQEARPIQLYGLWFEGSSAFRVRFEEFQREDNGKWSRVEVGYCGTGAQLYSLEPKKDYVFLVPLWPFLETGQKGIVEVHGTNVTVSSAPFDTSAIRKIGDQRKRTANHTSNGIRQPADRSPKPSR